MTIPRLRFPGRRWPPGPGAVKAARRALLSLAFAVALTFVGVAAALTASSSLLVVGLFEACAVAFPLAALFLLELGPAVTELRRDTAAARRVMRSFRDELDALPERPHPLGA